MATNPLQETIIACLVEAQCNHEPNQKKALQALFTITMVSSQNRNLLSQTNGSISTLFTLIKSSSKTLQILALSILFNLSLNPNLKHVLATMDNISTLNSIILSLDSSETVKSAASLLCSLAMLDKNKAKFGVVGSVQTCVNAIATQQHGSAVAAQHHLLSFLAELVQFHGNCTLAVRSGAVSVLLQLVQTTDHHGEDLVGTALAILCLLARFDEGLISLSRRNDVVLLMIDVLKGRSMFSKEGAASILVMLFDGNEECLKEALKVDEFLCVVADLSIRGSGRAREKAGLLMKKMMKVSSDAYVDEY